MSWLSPVQWAKWTWITVTGSPGEEGKNDGEDNSDSERTFDTPETQSPAVVNLLNQQENSNQTDSSPDSSVVSSCDISGDSDLLNGTTNPQLSNEKLTPETDGGIITNSCNVNQNGLKQNKDDQPGGLATDEEKLASNAGPECHVMSKPEESDCCSVYFDTCKMINKAQGCETQKTGSQVQVSLCISEAEKQVQSLKDEIVTKELEVSKWKNKYEESRQEVSEMRMVVAEFENAMTQMIDIDQQRRMDSQKALQALKEEKETALKDLNSVECSLSELFQRYESMRRSIDGFLKNEALLKKCAEDCVAWVKKEQERYHTLKHYAEGKIEMANKEIAQVRAKFSSEKMVLTTNLRQEQLKINVLEQSMQQKNKVVEELTNICNELIAKLENS
ncbi:transforming acidic coiled-coil-containing protein 1 [Cynoglossus semilaevis]|uniref:Transforming acidic coiled-coil containing protein 1 n=1 Tax=Cynoglossus semilaevis TaxID=244447 RepID=A0A3P8W1K6_CYNSE|nr:transforming acidic coiled-coil-containing protein 1 [Cynoglossus semilaevis]